MKAYYIEADGHARKHEFQKAPDGMWNVWGHMKPGDVFFVRRRRKPARYDVYRLYAKPGKAWTGRTFPAPVFTHPDKTSALAWAQMFAAMSKGDDE